MVHDVTRDLLVSVFIAALATLMIALGLMVLRTSDVNDSGGDGGAGLEPYSYEGGGRAGHRARC